jgi:myo-inositol-1(or 4)-monophosphatase
LAPGTDRDIDGWLPDLVQEIRRLGEFQLAGQRDLRPADVRVKEESGEPSVVTRYDLESEMRLRDFVARRFPAHSFLGEETGNDRRDAEHYWICDPIDGTSNFVDGIPYWGTSLAYWRAGRVELGLMYFPALDRLYAARRGGGATCNGEPIRPSTAREYGPLATVGLDSRSHLRHVLRLRVRVRILGSAIANQCLTASGTYVASVTRAKLWDLAAGALLLAEAGAMVESSPDLARADPAGYARGTDPASRFTLHARANSALPPLTDHLFPAQPVSGRR